ncbi:MAG: hypothetical protein IJ809_04715 [Clostridia bacterium]|nr:hypothetical protein [Clostridia bacterium]
MVAIGYEMYISMLEKAVSRAQNGKNIDDLKEQEMIKNREVKIDLGVSAYIPDTYISDMVQKISMYHKISEIENKKESVALIEEMLDRYGTVPKEVENLIKIVEIRNICRELGIKKISRKNASIIISSDKLEQDLIYNLSSKDVLLSAEFYLKELQKMINKNNK